MLQYHTMPRSLFSPPSDRLIPRSFRGLYISTIVLYYYGWGNAKLIFRRATRFERLIYLGLQTTYYWVVVPIFSGGKINGQGPQKSARSVSATQKHNLAHKCLAREQRDLQNFENTTIPYITLIETFLLHIILPVVYFEKKKAKAPKKQVLFQIGH